MEVPKGTAHPKFIEAGKVFGVRSLLSAEQVVEVRLEETRSGIGHRHAADALLDRRKVLRVEHEQVAEIVLDLDDRRLNQREFVHGLARRALDLLFLERDGVLRITPSGAMQANQEFLLALVLDERDVGFLLRTNQLLNRGALRILTARNALRVRIIVIDRAFDLTASDVHEIGKRETLETARLHIVRTVDFHDGVQTSQG